MNTPGVGGAPLRKGFVATPHGRLHYARAGQGPVVVMLHASPCSAKVMAPIQEIWQHQFTTIAFDLPGFGLSEGLTLDPIETEDLADAVAAGIRALGIGKAGLYGRHTGAGVAVEIARRHPDLCSMVLTDGFPVFSNPYSPERLDEYLQPYVPSWDGSHLTWAWYRYREQYIFWPWDRPLIANRAKADLPDVDHLHRGTVELLEAGPGFAKVYASAFRHRGLQVIDSLQVPVCFGNRPGDSQHKTMGLYPTEAWVREFSRDQVEAAVAERQVLALHPGQTGIPAVTTVVRPGAEGYREDYLDTASGQTFACAAGLDKRAMPLVVLSDLPGASVLHAELVAELGAARPCICFDFWGHGESPELPGEPLGVELWMRQTLEVLAALDFDRCDVLAIGASAMILSELLLAHPERVARPIYWSPPVVAPAQQPVFLDDYAPSIEPTEEGAHLLRLWHHLRDQELFWPCFDKAHTAARRNQPRLDVDDLTRRARALLKQPGSYRPTWQAIWSYPLQNALAKTAPASLLLVSEDHVFAPLSEHAALALGTSPHWVGSDPAAAAALVDRLLRAGPET